MESLMKTQYRVRFGLLLYGLFRLLKFTAFVSPSFRKRIGEKNYNFSMTSKEKEIIRYFKISEGKIYSRSIPMPVDFSLIWKDEPTGVRIMTELVTGKPKVLAKAVIDQKLFLEGDAAMVYWYLETVNEMARVYKKKKSKKTS